MAPAAGKKNTKKKALPISSSFTLLIRLRSPGAALRALAAHRAAALPKKERRYLTKAVEQGPTPQTGHSSTLYFQRERKKKVLIRLEQKARGNDELGPGQVMGNISFQMATCEDAWDVQKYVISVCTQRLFAWVIQKLDDAHPHKCFFLRVRNRNIFIISTYIFL